MQYILSLIPLEYYAFTGLLNFFTALVIFILTILKNFQSKVNRAFSAFAFSVASWSIFYFLWLRTPDNKVLAEFYLRTCMIPVFFMPSAFYQFVVYFLNISYKRIYLLANYILSIVFTLTVYTSLYSHNPTPFFSIPYWMNAGIACHLAISHFGIVIGYTWYLLLKRLKTSGGIFRNQLRYVFVGTLIGFIGGSTNYFGWYKIPFPPVFNILVSVYMGLIAYAILKHRLMNIDVVIKKSVTDFLLFLGISVVSILIILGVENKFYQGINLRMLNFLFILLLIPGAYLFRKLKPATEKKVERMLFKDKYDYLESLAKLGQRAVTYLDLDKLLDDVVNSLAGELKLDDVAVYIFQEEGQEYWLAKDFKPENKKMDRLTLFDPCIAFLNGRGRIIVWDEERQCSGEVLARVNEAKIAVTVPLVFEKKTVGIVQLSDKTSKEIYSQEDLELLHALAERISSGLANAKEHGASDELYKIRSRQERITSLAEMSGGLCHQLNNPLTPIKGFLQLIGKEGHKLEDLGVLKGEAEKAVDRIVKIIKEVKVFSETGVNIAHIQADVNAMLRKSVPLIVGARNFDPLLDLDENLPTILGDEKALLDVFVAIGTNGIEAMFERRRDENANARDLLKSGIPPEALVKMGILKDVKDAADIMAQLEEKRENKLTIRTRRGDPVGRPVGAGSKPAQYIRVEITDTGEGIKPEDLAKIFNPMHSTKSMHIGLSLAIAHRLVEAHGGYMEVKSKVGEGTSFFVNLPLAYNPSGKEIIQEKEAQRSGQRAWEAVGGRE